MTATSDEETTAFLSDTSKTASTEDLIKAKVQGLTGVVVSRDTPLVDLGLDSLGTTALLSTIRSATPLAEKLSIHDLSSIDTVGELVDFLENDPLYRTSDKEKAFADEEAGLARTPTMARTLASTTVHFTGSSNKSTNQNGTVTIPARDGQYCASVVLCHGLGGTADSLVDIAEHLAEQMPHIRFILPTAPTQPVSKNIGEPMPSWYDVVGLADRSKETYSGIADSAETIRFILRDEHERTGLPHSRMVLAGFSQGGALSLYVGMQLEMDEGPLAGILLLSGYLPCPERFRVTTGLEDTPILHLHGESDDIVPYETANESQQRAMERGANRYDTKGYPGVAHTVSPEEVEDMAKFLLQVLPPEKNCGAKLIDHKREYTRSASIGKTFKAARSHLITIALLIISGIAIIVVRVTMGNTADTSYSHASEGQSPKAVIDPEQVRFNKFSLLRNKSINDDPWCSAILPLGPTAYPISRSPTATPAQCMLKNHTNAVSVVAADDWECSKLDVAKLITMVGGPPPEPISMEGGQYWDELDRVIDVQKIRLKRGGELSRVVLPDFPLPYRWVEFTVNDVARAVHDEYPGLHQANLISDFMSGTYGRIELDTEIIPQRSNVQFLRGAVALAELNQWAIGRVGSYNFAAKWHVGRARPEEMLSAIQSGTVSYIPPTIQKKVKELPWTSSPADFTAYPEGAPRHPSWPAMHAAASGLSFWLSVVLNLTPQQHCQVKLVDHAVAWARTVAGVHYEDDNIAGLDMGQEVMSQLLPEHLATTYGADLAVVQAKVKAMRFSWREFDMKNPCPGTEWMLWHCKSRSRRCSFRGPASVPTAAGQQ